MTLAGKAAVTPEEPCSRTHRAAGSNPVTLIQRPQATRSGDVKPTTTPINAPAQVFPGTQSEMTAVAGASLGPAVAGGMESAAGAVGLNAPVVAAIHAAISAIHDSLRILAGGSIPPTSGARQ